MGQQKSVCSSLRLLRCAVNGGNDCGLAITSLGADAVSSFNGVSVEGLPRRVGPLVACVQKVVHDEIVFFTGDQLADSKTVRGPRGSCR
jgi:hypothetical protein